MKGYKALNMNMRAIYGNGMLYEMDKWYSTEGELVLCYNGFHFCEKIEDLCHYYNIMTDRIFEVEASGDIKNDSTNYVAQKIRLVRELTRQEIKDYFRENWKSLVKSDSYDIRTEVARQGYGLDILIHDKNWRVRNVAISQCRHFDKLISDTDYSARCVAAKMGYRLDILISDEDWHVRKTVVEQGYGLYILVNDICKSVRDAAELAIMKNNIKINA